MSNECVGVPAKAYNTDEEGTTSITAPVLSVW